MSDSRQKSLPLRYKVAGLLFAGSAVNFIDRVNISVAAPAMMLHTGLRKDQFGLVFSAFLLGYALMQIPSGMLADRGGARKMIALAFCGFSLFTALTPAGAHSLLWLLLVRFAVGLCESPTFPSITALNTRWFPPGEFGRAQTFSLSGGSVGQMIAYPLTAWIVLQASWQSAFYVNAAMGFVWAFIWLRYSTDRPATDQPATRDLPAPLHLATLLRSAPVLLLAMSAVLFAFVLWTFLFWFPTYLVQGRGFSLGQVGVLGFVIQGCGFAGTVISGAVSDWLLRRTGRPRLARTCFAGCCVGTSVILLLSAVAVASNQASVVLFALFYFCLLGTHVAFLTGPAVLHPRQAASIYGIVNTGASLGAVCGPAVVGFLVAESPDWQRSFTLVGSVGLLAALLLFMVPLRMLDIGPHPTRRLSNASDGNAA